jgi:hypothetical protein
MTFVLFKVNFFGFYQNYYKILFLSNTKNEGLIFLCIFIQYIL